MERFLAEVTEKTITVMPLTTFAPEALKLDYSDFIGIKSADFTQDLFDVYRSTLTRIFKLLKRFGILLGVVRFAFLRVFYPCVLDTKPEK